MWLTKRAFLAAEQVSFTTYKIADCPLAALAPELILTTS